MKYFEEFRKFPYLINEVLDIRNITLKGINSTIQIGKISEINAFNYSNNLEYKTQNTISTIDFGICPQILRAKFEMKETVNMLFKNLYFDVVSYGDQARSYLYREDDLEKPLDLTSCEGQNIIYINPSTDYLKYFKEYYNGELYLEFFVNGNQIFDLYSPIYNDCYPLSISNGIDLTIKDRMEDLKKNGFILCEEGCRYEGFDLKTFQVRCFCPIKIENRTINEGIKDMKKWNNFKVLKCYLLLFSNKGKKYNYFSEILKLILIRFLYLINLYISIINLSFLLNLTRLP